MKMLRIILLQITVFIKRSDFVTVTYLAASPNPPHGCLNYGLCTQPTTTLVSSTNETESYRIGCESTDDCVCVDGVTNGTDTCDTIIDQCSSNPCSTDGHFTCETGINTYECTCESGWTGENCDTELGTACEDEPCENGGSCTANDTSDYSCECAENYYGDNCEYENLCADVNCNYGTCEMVLNDTQFYCTCDDGYQGRYCDLKDYTLSSAEIDKCYYYDDDKIEDCDTKFKDDEMTVDMCNEKAAEYDPVMTILTLSGKWCMMSNEMLADYSSYMWESACSKECPGDSDQSCGKLNSRVVVYDAGTKTEDPNPCALNTSLCNSEEDHGKCIDMRNSTGDGYKCICGPYWTGSDCDTPVDMACDSEPCVNGTCIQNDRKNTYTCECDEGFSGDNCEYENQCTNTTCLYGGTCVEESGNYTCNCLSLYSGNRCQDVDRCNYSDPCVHGSCSTNTTTISTGVECSCEEGWTGEYCDTMINYCDDEPCEYNSTCTPEFMGYECTCESGLTGEQCETIIDLCVPTEVDGVWYETPCNTKDENANCTAEINSFSCSCSDKWTEELCDLNVLIKEVLMTIYGYVDLNMISLLNDLLNTPAEIKDMVPFIVGLLSYEERLELSWSVDDLFHWIAFEDQMLSLEDDLEKWNDIVLGNCFTFNHRFKNYTYSYRRPGRLGGFLAYMKTGEDDYTPWSETAAINVFVHDKADYVFSESVRYNAPPNAQSNMNIYNTKYTRLGGKYGACINDPSEVAAYYYEGKYATDGCLRTCYQDMVYDVCGCMDPRYPTRENVSVCELSGRSCVTDAADEAGDPSTWDSCVCPLPCSNQQYSVSWNIAGFIENPVECNYTGSEDCKSTFKDSLLISITLPQLDYKLFEEDEEMGFNKFLSQLGGQLGVLMGINLVSFIELLFLIFKLIALIFGKKNL